MEKTLTKIDLSLDKDYCGFIVNNDYRCFGYVCDKNGEDELFVYGKYMDGHFLELCIDGNRHVSSKINQKILVPGNFVFQEYSNFDENGKPYNSVYTLPLQNDKSVVNYVEGKFVDHIESDPEFYHKYETYFGTLPVEKRPVISEFALREF